jgi:hypothetical protein
MRFRLQISTAQLAPIQASTVAIIKEANFFQLPTVSEFLKSINAKNLYLEDELHHSAAPALPK